MTEIIDMRLRPPLPSWLKTPLFAPGGKSATWHPDFPRPASADTGAIADLLEEMDAAGVAIGVVMGRQSAGGLGSVPNEEIAGLVRVHPSRFVAWVGIDVGQPTDAILAEIDRFVGEHGFRGVSIEPSLVPEIGRADDPRLFPVYERCVALDLPVSITLSSVLQASERQPVERAHPAQIYNLALAFPRLAIHVAHAAWPWAAEMVAIAISCRNVWLSPDQYMLGPIPGSDTYAKAALHYLADRTLFGTAYPFKPLAPAVDSYRQWHFPPAIAAAVFAKNARRLMGGL
ncbi:MAG: amidohydrolase family protein [Reyranellaceae bacterium]